MQKIGNTLIVLALAVTCIAAGATPAHAGSEGWFDFVKNRNDQTYSTLSWGWNSEATGHQLTTLLGRAGSGVTQNECEIAKGWLPNGWYSGKGHWNNYDGSKIKGRVWYLQDKRCANGTYRTQLFIHSEETASNGQSGCQTPPGDSPWCWEGIYDYRSLGCVKMSWGPDAAAGTIGDAHNRYHHLATGGDPRHGAYTVANQLMVH